MKDFDERLKKLTQELLVSARKLRQSVGEIPGDKHLEDLGRQIESKAETLLAQQIKPVSDRSAGGTEVVTLGRISVEIPGRSSSTPFDTLSLR